MTYAQSGPRSKGLFAARARILMQSGAEANLRGHVRQIGLRLDASTARGDAPVYDHAFPVWRDFDCNYSEALSKPDGGARFGPADIGTLGDPCHR